MPFLTDPAELEPLSVADEKLKYLVNEKLSLSRNKHVYIYVHGYKVVFDNPLILAAQLWHFMDRDGVFIPFAWTSTPNRLAYLKDVQTAEISARNLRLLLQFLIRETDVDKIHIVGYSAGTRVVIGALNQLNLMSHGDLKAGAPTKIGQVILAGSDYDRQRWISMISDGLLDITDAMTVYVSPYDDALGLSKFVLGGERLGALNVESLSPTVRHWLATNQRLFFVDVSGVDGSELRNGHAYFQSSPWISADILTTLLYGLKPSERGLVQQQEALSWSFPQEYDSVINSIVENMAESP